MEDSGSKKLLVILPNELRFPFETKKRISCSLQLRNRTDECIAFKVMVTHPKKYAVQPNYGIVPPQSNCDVTVTMQAQIEAPPDMQCKDKFLVQSVVVGEGATRDDIAKQMLKKRAGNAVNEVKMRVVYVQPPGTLSSVLEGSEEGSMPRPSWSDEGHIYFQDATMEFNEPPLLSDLGAHKEPEEITSEEASCLTEPSPSSSTSDSKGWVMQRSDPDSNSNELLAIEPTESSASSLSRISGAHALCS